MPGLMSAMQTAATGILASHAKAAQAAEDIATASMPQDRVTISGERPPDVVRSMLDLRIARYTALANMQTIRTADAMLQDVVNIGSRR